MSRRSRLTIHPAPTTVSIERSVLLWCMRLWVCGPDNPVIDERIALAFGRIGDAEAACYFHRFMRVLREGAQAPIAVQCVCWRGVAQDEHAVLDCFALAQEARALEALMLLRGFVAPAMAGAALDHAENLGAALARVGWFLAAPALHMTHFAMTPDTGTRPSHSKYT